MSTEREALVGATNRFVAFFRELEATFVERTELLRQIALALLAREHVLMTGPPGTAKSKLAQAVLGRILCEETRLPSLFARQFTESTVQTDLVGPINFKTLMETGRTEHFTDEGILGATHAFLDEVFDGRDMLLRSTLNLLNERELKQGTKISRGKIECALMTSNRYLVEVLENERLVAFVDRIAFLNFVPKGFATAASLTEVLRRQVAGHGTTLTHARLTVEDLDLLQNAVETVQVSEAMCASVATLASSYDAALASARRADPSFVPSRYVSTRGIVRLGELLRAACFYDWAFHDRARPLEAYPSDLGSLRLGLTLCGPGPSETAQLLEKDPDPRERRQLQIVQAEREMFDRCLAELSVDARRPEPLPLPPQLWSESTPQALEAKDAGELAELARELAAASARRQPGAEQAAARLAATLQKLVDRALAAGLNPGANGRPDPVAVVAELGKLADHLDHASPAHRPIARWLRGRALEVATLVAALGPSPFAAGAQHLTGAAGDVDGMTAIAVAQLQRAEQLASLRVSLRQAGALEPDAASSDAAWAEAIEKVAQRLWPDLAVGFAAATERVLARLPEGSLPDRLHELAPTLEVVRLAAKRLAALDGDGEALFARIVTGPLGPLVHQSFRGIRAESRAQLSEELAKDISVLTEAGLLGLLPGTQLGPWIAETLLRGERAQPPAPPAKTGALGSVALYRKVRGRMPASTLAFTLVELLARFPSLAESGADPDRIVARVAEVVRTFSAEVRGELVARDLAYVEAPLAFLERWWQELSQGLPREPRPALERLMNSGFFALTHDECALARFELEAQLVALVLEGAEVAPLRERIAGLAHASTELVERLSVQRLGGPADDEPAPRAAAARP
jgi:MoxR-like ATPase